MTVRDLQPHQWAVLVLFCWLVLAIALQLPVLIRSARDGVDWQVVSFRGALLFLSGVAVVEYVFDLTPWLFVVGMLVLDVAATMNTVYIRRRARED